MLTDLCQELRNWFEVERHTGTFEITDGRLTASFLQDSQYYRIIGSVFNDGVHQYPNDELRNETFTGTVVAMAIPQAVIDLDAEIEAWIAAYGKASASPYASESFGGYSYTKATASGTGADKTTWQGVFRSRLNKWRKL